MDRPLIVLRAAPAALRGAPHLVALGAVRIVDGEVQESFESLVCPPVPIEPDAAAEHGVTERAVRAAPLAAQCVAGFADWVGEAWMAAHDARRDGEALAYELARAGVETPPGPMLDGKQLAERHLADAPDRELETLAAWLELESGERSGVLADAVQAWKVIEECLERAGGGTRPADVLAAGGRPLGLAALGPRAAKTSPRHRSLERARVEGRRVAVLYGGEEGEAPARIEVVPRFLFGRGEHGYMEAECVASGLLKTYRLDRVRKVVEAE